jgi:hypothetical protein
MDTAREAELCKLLAMKTALDESNLNALGLKRNAERKAEDLNLLFSVQEVTCDELLALRLKLLSKSEKIARRKGYHRLRT